MKKFLFLAVIAGGAYMAYRQWLAAKAEDDLWSEATAAPDLSSSYQRPTETPLTVVEEAADSAADTASNAAEDASDAVEDAADTVADKAEDVSDAVADAADSAADAAADKS